MHIIAYRLVALIIALYILLMSLWGSAAWSVVGRTTNNRLIRISAAGTSFTKSRVHHPIFKQMHCRQQVFLFSNMRSTSIRDSNGRSNLPNNEGSSVGSSVDMNEIDSGSVKLRKSKVALVIGFIGTDFHGMQFQSKSDTITVEKILEEALYKAGFISTANHNDINKIGWSRSSRTDKGVHANRVVISVKLQFDPSWMSNDNRVPLIVEKANEYLPSSIRVFSCYKVTNSFRARQDCSWREYEYVLPLDFLKKNIKFYDSLPTNSTSLVNWTDADAAAASDEKLISEFMQHLQKMVGSHSFHNYNNDQKRRKFLAADTVSAESGAAVVGSTEETCDVVRDKNVTDNNVDGNTDEESEIEESDMHNDESGLDPMPLLSQSTEPEDLMHCYDNLYARSLWNEKYFTNLFSACKTSIYSISNEGLILSDDGAKLLKIRLRGKAFFFNQIRIMIATAVLCVRGAYPPFMVEFSLKSLLRLVLSKAPAEGLVLVNAGFSRRTPNGGLFSLFPSDKSNDSNASQQPPLSMISNYSQGLKHNANNIILSEVALMTKDEYEKSEEFMKKIYIVICNDWSAKSRKFDFHTSKSFEKSNGSNLSRRAASESYHNATALENWIYWSEWFRVPYHIGLKWKETLENSKVLQSQKADMRSVKGVNRIQNILGIFNEALSNPLFRESFQTNATACRKDLNSNRLPVSKFSKEQKKMERSIQKIIAVYGLVNWIIEQSHRRILSESEATAIVRKLIATGHLQSLYEATLPFFSLLSYIVPSGFNDDGNRQPQAETKWILGHKNILPNSLSTEMTIYFDTIRGICDYKDMQSHYDQVAVVVHHVALMMLRGELSPTLNATEIIQHLDSVYFTDSSDKAEIANKLESFIMRHQGQCCPWLSV